MGRAGCDVWLTASRTLGDWQCLRREINKKQRGARPGCSRGIHRPDMLFVPKVGKAKVAKAAEGSEWRLDGAEQEQPAWQGQRAQSSAVNGEVAVGDRRNCP